MAQNTNWDKALDEYEHICNECIIIRTRIAQGENIPEGSVTSILNRLSGLRTSLQSSSDRMSQSQVQRFYQIRDRYSAVMGTFSSLGAASDYVRGVIPEAGNGSHSRTGIVSPETRKDAQLKRTADRNALEQDSVVQTGKDFLYLLENETAKTSFSIETAGLSGSESLSKVALFPDVNDYALGVDHVVKEEKAMNRMVMASVQLGRQASWGAFLGMGKGRFGGFLLARSNFKKAGADGRVQGDGTVPGHGQAAFSGKTAYETWNLAVGPMVTVDDWLNLYAGAGYGLKRLSWEETSGKWMEVSDFFHKGIALEGGALLSYKSLCFGIGFCCLGEVDTTISLGVGF